MEIALQHRAVNFLHHALGHFVLGAHHDAVGMQKILDGRALAQKFRIGRHVKRDPAFAAVYRQRALQFLPGLRRNGALLDHQFFRARFGAHQPRHMVDGAQVRGAGRQRRRPHADENCVAGGHSIHRICAKAKQAFPARVADDGVEARLENRQAAGFQRFYFCRVAIRAHHFMADARQASAGHQSHIPGADYGNLQMKLP